MPHRRSGNKVLHKKGGKWKVKQTCKSPAAAQKAINLLRGVEHGWKPTGKPARKKSSAKRRSKRGGRRKRA